MNNLHGILLMILANALFAGADALIKLASSELSPGHIILILGLGGAVVYSALARVRGEKLWHRAAVSPPVLGRCLSEIIGAASMITALALAPLSAVAAILQVSPLVVTLLAAFFLGERVGWRRWLAVGVGFTGMLLIIQPWGSAFDIGLLLAVVGMLALSARDLFTRLAPPGLPTTSLAFYGTVSILVPGIALTLAGPGPLLPETLNWWLLLAMVGFGSTGYLAITQAVRIAEISVVAPFRYTRLLFAMILGFALFAERPDALVLTGAALILGAGLYAWARERRHAKPLEGQPRRS